MYKCSIRANKSEKKNKLLKIFFKIILDKKEATHLEMKTENQRNITINMNVRYKQKKVKIITLYLLYNFSSRLYFSTSLWSAIAMILLTHTHNIRVIIVLKNIRLDLFDGCVSDLFSSSTTSRWFISFILSFVLRSIFFVFSEPDNVFYLCIIKIIYIYLFLNYTRKYRRDYTCGTHPAS